MGPSTIRLLGIFLLIAGPGTTALLAKEPVPEKFFQAYYLEHEAGDFEAAGKLYAEVADDSRVDKAVRERAANRAAACQEELASRDFARLMPPTALAYLELSRPGDRVSKLLDQLGLLRHANLAFREAERRVAISPVLVKEVLGLGGAAVAITGVDLKGQKPAGVIVVHPGNLEAIRGLVESALPAAAEAVEPIGGFATFNVENEALVTLTARLIIIGSDRGQNEAVVERLAGREKSSLADNEALREMSGDRGDSLLTFFINAKPIMPMLQGLIAAQASQNPEIAMAQAVLDPASFHSLIGRMAIGDDGLGLEIALRLDEGHRNLAFHFLRSSPINPDTLAGIPDGAAAVLVGALNDPGSRYSSRPAGAEPAPVTLMDLGREVFANITTYALFVLPSDDPAPSGPPIPDVGLVMTVNDPAKSEALWTQMLGIAHLASGGKGLVVEPTKLEGVPVRGYQMPEGLTLHFAAAGNDVMIATKESVIARAIAARKNNRSITDDQAFAAAMKSIGEHTTQAVLVHAGRLSDIAKRFVPAQDLAEAAPIMQALSNTVAALTITHSNNAFRLALSVSGMPNVGDFVARELTQQAAYAARGERIAKLIQVGDWREAQKAVAAAMEESPGNLGLLERRFTIEAIGLQDHASALRTADDLFERQSGNATWLNNFAWNLLTKKSYERKYDDVALRFSRRSNELTSFENWIFLDTLALATSRTGDVNEAVELQTQALALCGSCSGRGELEGRLAQFEQEQQSSVMTQASDAR